MSAGEIYKKKKDILARIYKVCNVGRGNVPRQKGYSTCARDYAHIDFWKLEAGFGSAETDVAAQSKFQTAAINYAVECCYDRNFKV